MTEKRVSKGVASSKQSWKIQGLPNPVRKFANSGKSLILMLLKCPSSVLKIRVRWLLETHSIARGVKVCLTNLASSESKTPNSCGTVSSATKSTRSWLTMKKCPLVQRWLTLSRRQLKCKTARWEARIYLWSFVSILPDLCAWPSPSKVDTTSKATISRSWSTRCVSMVMVLISSWMLLIDTWPIFRVSNVLKLPSTLKLMTWQTGQKCAK